MAPTPSFLSSADPGTVFVCLAGLLPAVVIILAAARAIASPLRSVPGPLLARFSRLWYLSSVWKGDFEKINIALHRKHGSIVRIAPGQYSIDDAEAIKIIYGHGSSFLKSDWYNASGDPNPNAHDFFTEQDASIHASLRRKVASLYSMTSLLQLEPFVQECTERLLSKLSAIAQAQTTVNMQSWMQYYAFDTIGLITFDAGFGFLDEGRDHTGMLKTLHSYLRYAANVGIYSGLHPYLFKIYALIPNTGFMHMINFTQTQIQKRLALPGSEKRSERGDFLTKLLRMHGDNPDKITMEDVFVSCLTNVGAGSDTTSISLTSILYYLLKNPASFHKLRYEIDATNSTSTLTTYAQTQTMPYLQAVIKEALRMHPATGLPLMRVVPSPGATIAGHFFPAGSVVGVNTWVAHRNKAIFGADADEFRPERWMESPERSSAMERYFMAFGAGSRTCIGRNISLLEISKLVPELVRRFDFEVVSPRTGEELKTENVWFVKQMDFCCRLRRRDGWEAKGE